MSRFDEYADSYTDAVQDAIAFGGEELEYYTRRKAELLLDVLRRRLGSPGSLSVLDIGCGIGATDTFLTEHIGELHGVDTSVDCIARAGQRNPEVAYRAYDGGTLPYDDGTMDAAFAICVLHHVEPGDRATFAAEMRRVVRPGGIVAVFEHNPYNPLTRKVVRDCPFDEGVELLHRRFAVQLLHRAGLHPLESRYIIFIPADRSFVPRVERGLARLPLGAQYYVAARR